MQLEVDGVQREVAAPGKAEPGDLVVALGGDGTVLAALRAAAASDAPVLGVASGSLGVLSAVSAEELLEALDRFGPAIGRSDRCPPWPYAPPAL